MPNPTTAQLNRFYTVEFFRSAARHLRSGGLLSFQVEGSENYISEELRRFLACIYKTLSEVFNAVEVMPGPSVHFFASDSSEVVSLNVETMTSRLHERQLETLFVREQYFAFRLMPDRTEELKRVIKPELETPINSDLTPIAYYYDLIVWTSQFAPSLNTVFTWLVQLEFWEILVALLVIYSLWGARSLLRKGTEQKASAVRGCVFAMGVTLIGLQVLIFLGFQTIYGYIYQEIASILALLMLGLGVGSYLASRRKGNEVRDLASIQGLAVVAPLMICCLFLLVSWSQPVYWLFEAGKFSFHLASLGIGFLGGFQFPTASRIYFTGAKKRSWGSIYGLDLLGACVGSLLISVFLIPNYGFLQAGLTIGIVNIVPAFVALRCWRESFCH
jgi:spermidine synthase